MDNTLPERCDNRSTTDDDLPLPQLDRTERFELRAAHRAIPRVDQRTAELGRLMLAAVDAYKAHPTDENHDRMIAAEQRYKAGEAESDRGVERYVALERAVIRRARAREDRARARLLATPPRPDCEIPRQTDRRQRQRQRRSHRIAARTAAKATADPDGPAEQRGADVLVTIERRAEPGRRDALVELLVDLIELGAGGAR